MKLSGELGRGREGKGHRDILFGYLDKMPSSGVGIKEEGEGVTISNTLNCIHDVLDAWDATSMSEIHDFDRAVCM
jgi:hypothetical protein